METHTADFSMEFCHLNNLMKIKWFTDFCFGKLMGADKVYPSTYPHTVQVSGLPLFSFGTDQVQLNILLAIGLGGDNQ